MCKLRGAIVSNVVVTFHIREVRTPASMISPSILRLKMLRWKPRVTITPPRPIRKQAL